MSTIVDYPVEVVTGQEVLLGSTRMKAGTAEKLIINMISTAAMIRLGYTYKNTLIGQTTTEKSWYRGIRVIANETGKSEEETAKVFEETGQDPKLTICMLKTGYEKDEAAKLLEKYSGRLREALHSIGID